MFSLIETHFITTLKYTKSKQNVVKVKHRVQTLAGALLIVNEGRKQISMLLLISFISHSLPPNTLPPSPRCPSVDLFSFSLPSPISPGSWSP